VRQSASLFCCSLLPLVGGSVVLLSNTLGRLKFECYFSELAVAILISVRRRPPSCRAVFRSTSGSCVPFVFCVPFDNRPQSVIYAVADRHRGRRPRFTVAAVPSSPPSSPLSELHRHRQKICTTSACRPGW